MNVTELQGSHGYRPTDKLVAVVLPAAGREPDHVLGYDPPSGRIE